ncbi:hypothetical protein J4G48_0040290 [Bradyrhizobium barranii subsp. apii]|uniref:hypothetical protein n=1 Tax=Bradyrhizobium barranii TaxID=2992140 RepID=UPI001AA194B6|nr:hypothetical protein [Bradyrhizobium barranii]UPT95398.1 hypothetical protein J4G48_0040290 [Bradyrhizobium barranii subsp. apii]
MAKPKWQRILELEAQAKGRPAPEFGSSSNQQLDQMSQDLREIRRKQSIEFYAPGIALIILVVFVYWFLHA